MLTILTGPARCGKTDRLLAQYRAALAPEEPGTLLWLAPTWRAVNEVRQRLFEGPFAGCFSPGVMTFEKFAETVLRSAGVAIRPMTRLMKRELIRQIIAEQAARGRLTHFRSIAATAGLVDLIGEFISEMKRLEIWPEEFQRACKARGVGDKDVELLEIYEAYQQALREHGLFDAEGRFWSARDVLQKGGGHRLQLVIADGFSDFTRTQHEIIEILAERATTTVITLLIEEEPRRSDLFAKPLKTLAELRRRHPQVTVETIARPTAPAWPTIEHLERKLFLNPRAGTGDGGRGTREAVAHVAGISPPHAPGPTSPSPVSDIEILAAARQVGEMELLAGRIKRLLVDGEARPGDIAVVFRSPQDVTGLLGEVFDRFGIPVVFESGAPLDRAPCLRALSAMLRLDLDDWPFDQLLSVLGGNFFRPDWADWQQGRAAADVERTVRNLQTPGGRQRLLDQLNRALTKTESKSDDSSKSHQAARQTTLAILQCLAAALDALPDRATLPHWAAAWQCLARETGLLRTIEADTDARATDGGAPTRETAGESLSSPALADRHAWNRLMEVLAAGDRLAAWLEQRPPELNRRAALDALLDILASESIGHAGDESGCVRVLSASSIRSLRIPYVFLAGLSEKVFPPPERDNRLYSEAEYGRMIDAGLPFVPRTERTREEMLLFYEAVTRAGKRLYLSYPALDASAQPLLPSPFLREVEQAFAPLNIPRVERADLSPIPPDDEPHCAAEFRIKALATALDGNVALLAGLLHTERREEREKGETQRSLFAETQTEKHPKRGSAKKAKRGTPTSAAATPSPVSPLLSPLSSNLVAGLATVYLRQDRERFGPAEGLLLGTDAQSYFASRFPRQHVFSATDLEHYATCPFRFLIERVLGIEPLEELSLEFDVRNRGRAVHDVLAVFHRRVNERLGRPATPLELEAAEFDTLLAAVIDETLPIDTDSTVAAALREIDRRLVVQWLADYRQQLEKYNTLWQGFDTPMAAELFEISFGRSDDSVGPLEFVRGSNIVFVSGRVDRIDSGVVAGYDVFNVLDYKTGGSIRLTSESITAGTTLQLPIYAIATADLLLTDRDVLPWQAGYWYVRDGGFKPRQALRMYRNDNGRIELEAEWEAIRNTLGDAVLALVAALRRGRFPVESADQRCTAYCPYSTICRINQVRSLEKICQPANESVAPA